MLKQMYPDDWQSQEGRDRKAETLPIEEFEIVFDAVLQRYRRIRKKKEENRQDPEKEREEAANVEKVMIEERWQQQQKSCTLSNM